jgi:hypothetical protein
LVRGFVTHHDANVLAVEPALDQVVHSGLRGFAVSKVRVRKLVV